MGARAEQDRLSCRLGFGGKQTGVLPHTMDPWRPDGGGLHLGCCQPHQEPCGEERKVPASDLEKTLWFLVCGRKWRLAAPHVLH